VSLSFAAVDAQPFVYSTESSGVYHQRPWTELWGRRYRSRLATVPASFGLIRIILDHMLIIIFPPHAARPRQPPPASPLCAVCGRRGLLQKADGGPNRAIFPAKVPPITVPSHDPPSRLYRPQQLVKRFWVFAPPQATSTRTFGFTVCRVWATGTTSESRWSASTARPVPWGFSPRSWPGRRVSASDRFRSWLLESS
jgi:hypothetical protein